MRTTGDELGLPIHLYGPETHITAVVPLALGLRDPALYPEFDAVQVRCGSYLTCCCPYLAPI